MFWGRGFLEKVYENALAHELQKAGIQFTQQWPLVVRYDGVVVGEYFADLVVEGEILLELKAVRTLNDAHVAQGINYLKATGLKTCLLMNFGTARLGIKRLSL